MSKEPKDPFAPDISGRQGIEARLEYLTRHDPLTGLHNRPFFVQRLGAALTRCQQDPARDFAVLLLDLDRFKLINDSLSHSEGDLALIEIASRLSKTTRSHDLVARLGSDEFAMLIEGFDGVDDVATMARRIVDLIRHPIKLTGQEVYSSASIGVVYGKAAYETAENLLRDAGIAMQEAKRRNAGYVVFDRSVHHAAALSARLGVELQRAVARSEFFLEYQPIFDLSARGLRGVEALIRWQHPSRGRLYPVAFIQNAEDMGLIREIGAKMLRAACTRMRQWQRQRPDPCFRLNFNISGHELMDSQFIPRLQSILHETALVPDLLQLEVTESVLLPDTGPVDDVISQAKAIGVRILLDDFGTAYSSLGYLDRYPIDGIKIDRSFVAGMQSRSRTQTIVRAIVDLAHALEMETTAEGVEAVAQMDMLRALGCKHAQGFYLGKPASPETITELLGARSGVA